MSPILVRPVREQSEHDRVIRVLQARYKRKYEAVINPGMEQNAAVMVGELSMYPDVVLFGLQRGRKLQGTIEVETTESVNTLEAMAQWGPFSRLRVPFILYVPPNALDTARRLCAEHQIDPAEIWTYHSAADQVRFTMVHRSPDAPVAKVRPPQPAETRPAKPARKPAAARKPVRAAKTTRTAKTAKTAKRAPARKPARPAAASRRR